MRKGTAAPIDPRMYEPTAYITNGSRLYEIVEADTESVWLEDCRSGFRVQFTVEDVRTGGFKLVKEALQIPDEYQDYTPG